MKKRKPLSEETKRKIGLANSKPKITKICSVCNTTFYVVPARKDTAKFCSEKCMYKVNFGRAPWNKGTKGVMKAWNKGKKCPQFSGKNHWNWKGGEYSLSNGYILVWSPGHPHAHKIGYVLKHRLVMEKHIGRYLTKKEQVHHKDNNPKNNKITNLVLCKDHKEHKAWHKENGKHYARYFLVEPKK